MSSLSLPADTHAHTPLTVSHQRSNIVLITRKREILAARVSMTDDESSREAETERERERDITHDTHSSPFSVSL